MEMRKELWIKVLIITAICSSFSITCAHKVDTGYGNLLNESELAGIMGAVNRFWSAAAENDTPALRREVAGTKPLEWVHSWRQAYADFFDETAGKLERVAIYVPADQPEGIEILIEVPWVSCPPPFHDGERDRYHVRLVLLDGEWRIADVWKDIC